MSASNSLKDFYCAMDDAQELLNSYDSANQSEPGVAPEILKRATLIFVLTAWETYVEDRAIELFEVKFKDLASNHAKHFITEQFALRLKQFHNPDSLKTKHLFVEFFGIDVTEFWFWNNYHDPKEVKTVLNMWIKKRGEAVHRARINTENSHLIKRSELDKCLRFFHGLAFATDKALLGAS